MDNIVYVEKKQINDEIGGETRTFHLWMYLRLRLEQGTNEGILLAKEELYYGKDE